MRHCAVWGSIIGVGMVAGAVLCSFPSQHAAGQEKVKKKTAAKPLVKTDGLDAKFTSMQSDFLRETEKLATEYYDAGHYDKAKALLKTVLALDPKHTDADAKIKFINEKVMSAHETDFDLEADGAWHQTKILLTKDEPVRLSVKGTYKLMLNTMTGPAGLPAKDPKTDLVPGIPLGAVMGIIVTGEKERDGTQNRRGNPFNIGEGEEFSPKETGLLFVRVNCPPENKNTGKLKISMTGNLRTQ